MVNTQNKINVGQGGPINTADILEQLKKMKENLKEQVAEQQVNHKEELNENQSEIQVKDSEIIDENTEKEQNVERKKEYEEKQEVQEILQKEETKDTETVDISENKLDKVNEQIKELENMTYEETTKVDFNEMYTKLFGTKPIMTNTESIEEKSQNTAVDLIKDNVSVFEDIEEYKKPVYKFIGIVFNTYIIIEMDKEMYIIDQHAAHERIMYEKVKKNYYSESSKDSQMLLLPDIITLTHKEMDIARDNIEMFEKVGFSLEEFGENTIKLTGVPTVCIDIDNKELFLETLDEIDTVARTAKQEKEEKFIATVACKAAVKANMVLSKEEVENLMDKLLELPNPFTCPHGRPTAIKMSKYDIERKFARK